MLPLLLLLNSIHIDIFSYMLVEAVCKVVLLLAYFLCTHLDKSHQLRHHDTCTFSLVPRLPDLFNIKKGLGKMLEFIPWCMCMCDSTITVVCVDVMGYLT